MDLEKYTIEELVSLKEQVSELINDYKDGYTYICNVTSNGSTYRDKWTHNVYTLQELCSLHGDGEDNKVDVYSTNPNLDIQNYGDTKYIVSEDDYRKWKDYNILKNNIEKEKDKDELKYLKGRLEDFDMSFSEPVDYPIN